MAKLTLSIDDNVISAAKRYAKDNGISVSRMMENYLRAWAHRPERGQPGPITASLIGIAKGADPEAYKQHLVKKYE